MRVLFCIPTKSTVGKKNMFAGQFSNHAQVSGSAKGESLRGAAASMALTSSAEVSQNVNDVWNARVDRCLRVVEDTNACLLGEDIPKRKYVEGIM